MKQLHTFDEVFDSQKTFRAILNAMANPGRRESAAEAAGKLYGGNPAMLAVAMTLLDNSVRFCCLGDSSLAEQIHLLTHAPAAEAGEADYLFVTDPAQIPEAVAAAKCGTLENPHLSATLVIADNGEGEAEAVLYGPGIAGRMRCPLSETAAGALRLRDARHDEYPEGIDLIFLSPDGSFFSIPRLVKREEA